jgi:hypothetical protein
MMAFVMVVDVDSAICDVVFVAVVRIFVIVDPDTHVVGDQGHAFVRSAQGFLSRKGLLFVSTYRRRGS